MKLPAGVRRVRSEMPPWVERGKGKSLCRIYKNIDIAFRVFYISRRTTTTTTPATPVHESGSFRNRILELQKRKGNV